MDSPTSSAHLQPFTVILTCFFDQALISVRGSIFAKKLNKLNRRDVWFPPYPIHYINARITKEQPKYFFLYAPSTQDNSLPADIILMDCKPSVKKEHILYRPLQYVGLDYEVQDTMWIVQKGKMVRKTVKFVPAILKMYDQLLKNAVEHKTKGNATWIEISVQENGRISIINNGKAMSFHSINERTNVLAAIFGDQERDSKEYKIGYNVKIANAFSKYFYVETGSKELKRAIRIQWKDNMSILVNSQTIDYFKEDYTKVSAILDLQRFQIIKFSASFIGLLERRAFDMAGLNRLSISFNKKSIEFKSFLQYAMMFVKEPSEVFFDDNENAPRWKVILAKSQHGFQQLSFINSLYWTRNGGTHVNHVVSQIANKALEAYNKRLKDPNEAYTNSQKFRSNYMIFVSVFIDRPKFNSVGKDTLSNHIKELGSLYRISDAALHFMSKNNMLESFKEMAKQRDLQKTSVQVKKPAKPKLRMPRLQDAYNAGQNSRCTLIIVENQAARHLVACGLEVLGRELFGVYMVKGKLPNAREMNAQQIEHQDFSCIAKSIACGPEGPNIQQLRYSSVLIVAGQDHQGTSFKALLLNFFQASFPSLLKTKGFVKFFIPPVVRCTNSQGNIKEFLTLGQFKNWSSLNSLNEWTPSYLRDISSMSPLIMKELFSQLKRHCFSLSYQSLLDEDSLKIAYAKESAEQRKRWLEDYKPQATLDYNTNSKTISIKDFVDKELTHVFYEQSCRLIPSLIDGLRPMQRKVMHCLSRSGAKEIQVSQLAGIVMKGLSSPVEEATIHASIISLGQNHVGSNNFNLIEPIGHFGSRTGKDIAPSRHLHAALSSFARLLFPQDDEHVLEYKEEAPDAQPVYFVPIIPLVLVNGFDGSASLWKSVGLPYKVLDVVEVLKEKLTKNSWGLLNMLPFWQGFKGSVQLQKKGTFTVKGCFEVRGRTVHIREIPVTKSIKEYRAFLEQKLEGVCPQIQEVRQEHRGQNILFIVKFQEGRVPNDIQKYLKLSAPIQETATVLLGKNGRFKRYESKHQLLDEYYQTRLRLYQKRKEYLISKLTREVELIAEKVRFIKDVLSGQFSLTESEETWRLKFVRRNYKRYQQIHRLRTSRQKEAQFKDFEHLERLAMNDFSERRILQLNSERGECEAQLQAVRRASQKQLWMKELSHFEDCWKKHCKKRQEGFNEALSRADNCFQHEPSELSSRQDNENIQFSEISLDSKDRAELQPSKTEGVSQPQPIISNAAAKATPPPVQSQKQPTKSQTLRKQSLLQRNQFQLQIRQMQRKNHEFQEKLKRETKKESLEKQKQRQADKLKQRQAEKAKKETRLKDLRKERKPEKMPGKCEGATIRESLSKHMVEIEKKVGEDKAREKEEQERSEKSQRNYLPAPAPLPKITVPYHCDETTFQRNTVERKRFSSRDAKMDQGEIQQLQDSARRKQAEEERKKVRAANSTYIDLDD